MQVPEEECWSAGSWEQSDYSWACSKPHGACDLQVHNEWVFVQDMDSWGPSGARDQAFYWQERTVLNDSSSFISSDTGCIWYGWSIDIMRKKGLLGKERPPSAYQQWPFCLLTVTCPPLEVQCTCSGTTGTTSLKRYIISLTHVSFPSVSLSESAEWNFFLTLGSWYPGLSVYFCSATK